METIVEYFDALTQFLFVDSYTWLQEFVAWAVIKMAEAKLAFTLFMVQFSWGVAKSILDQLMISQQLTQVWNAADGQVTAWLFYFRVPEGLNMVLSAGITKVVLRMLKVV